jgi:hypothetical protein
MLVFRVRQAGIRPDQLPGIIFGLFQENAVFKNIGILKFRQATLFGAEKITGPA